MGRVLFVLAMIFCIQETANGQRSKLKATIDSSISLAMRQYQQLGKALPDSLFPRSVDAKQMLVTNKSTWWTNGFFYYIEAMLRWLNRFG